MIQNNDNQTLDNRQNRTVTPEREETKWVLRLPKTVIWREFPGWARWPPELGRGSGKSAEAWWAVRRAGCWRVGSCTERILEICRVFPSSRQLCACRKKAVEKQEAILRAQSGTGMLCVLTASVERHPNRYHLMPVINWLLLSSKLILHRLLCENGDEPFKRFSFASGQGVKLCRWMVLERC